MPGIAWRDPTRGPRDRRVRHALQDLSKQLGAAEMSSSGHAEDVEVTPFGSIAATDVQAALEEVVAEGGGGYTDEEAQDAVGGILTDSAAIVWTYNDAGPTISAAFASDMTTQAELDDFADSLDSSLATMTSNIGAVDSALAGHIADASDAHDASAISIVDAASDFTATDVEGALAELQTDHEADVTALTDHITDTAAAHAATAILVDSTNLDGVGVNVQAVLEELENQIAGSGIPGTIVDAKGDLIVSTAADTVARKAVGANGTVLGADSTAGDGLAWRIVPHTETTRAMCSGTRSTTSASYADVDGATWDTTIVKVGGTETHLDVRMEFSILSTAAGACRFGVRLNGAGTEYEVLNWFTNLTNARQPASGTRRITGLAAGTYTLRPRWAEDASATVSMNTADQLCLTVTETT